MAIRSDLRIRWRGLKAGLPVAVVVLGVLSGGCGGGEAPIGTAVIRDSLGIRIVESGMPAWSEGRGWSVNVDPTVSIGVVEGEEAYQFFFAFDAVRVPDGRILVANMGTSEVRVFSSEGRHLETIGGEGDGPGEFRSPSKIFTGGGDTVHVVDHRSISTLSLSEGYLESYPTVHSPLGRFSDGTVIGLGWAANVDPFQLGQVRDSLAILRYGAEGQLSDTLAVVAGRDIYRIERGGGISQLIPLFARDVHVTVRDDHVVTGDGAEFELRILNGMGELVGIVRRSGVERRLTPTLISHHEQRVLEEAESDERRQGWREIFANWSYPDLWPAFEDLLVDADGNVWARQYSIEPGQPASWSVFSGEGQWMGDVELPGELRVTDIGPDYVLGIETDELGVEYVRMHALTK